jgi:hypothetical protein
MLETPRCRSRHGASGQTGGRSVQEHHRGMLIAEERLKGLSIESAAPTAVQARRQHCPSPGQLGF